jgi:polar amino acid transport system substrate-binding protein
VLLLALAGLLNSALAQTEPYAVSIGIDQAPPYHWIDANGQAQGTMVAIMRQLVSNSGGTAKFLSCPWARCLKLTETGQVDMLFGVSKTAERAAFLHFVEPEMINTKVNFVFYQLPSAPPIHSYSQLYRLKVGVLRGGSYFSEFDTDRKLQKVEFVDLASAVVSLQRGRIDALIQPAGVTLPTQPDGATLAVAQYQHTEHGKGYVVLSKKFAHPDYLPRLSHEMARSTELKDFMRAVKAAKNQQ